MAIAPITLARSSSPARPAPREATSGSPDQVRLGQAELAGVRREEVLAVAARRPQPQRLQPLEALLFGLAIAGPIGAIGMAAASSAPPPPQIKDRLQEFPGATFGEMDAAALKAQESAGLWGTVLENAGWAMRVAGASTAWCASLNGILGIVPASGWLNAGVGAAGLVGWAAGHAIQDEGETRLYESGQIRQERSTMEGFARESVTQSGGRSAPRSKLT